ncbi:MAG: hypothetical protein EJNHJLOP_00038 [Methanophagales virus PBV082]|uniref:Uncharacterized protein n=1 Tax=Methanophagales virus PBV082 TaxID=3071307 RepID=A0AA46TDI9_9VIRU|nr:MAG: hypothetical protein QIT52_gp38 [Methanophagales virus PBV082]UYL64927.1 MAG: hypothetical protein EJNHJLOP_00038 [Methanophagales virus PBV082]
MLKWSEMREKLKAKEKYMFPIFCFLFGVVVGREEELQAIAPLIFVFTGLAVITLIYYSVLLAATLMSVKEEV